MAALLSYRRCSFDQLDLRTLYAVMRLRQEVFVVEQDCPYLDADGKDQASWHVLGEDADGILRAYTRLVPRGVSYANYPSIGRVVTSAAVRGWGEGYELMRESIAACRALWGDTAIKISAQSHLQEFYGRLGFVGTGPGYLEDNIPHRAMIRPAGGSGA